MMMQLFVVLLLGPLLKFCNWLPGVRLDAKILDTVNLYLFLVLILKVLFFAHLLIVHVQVKKM